MYNLFSLFLALVLPACGKVQSEKTQTFEHGNPVQIEEIFEYHSDRRYFGEYLRGQGGSTYPMLGEAGMKDELPKDLTVQAELVKEGDRLFLNIELNYQSKYHAKFMRWLLSERRDGILHDLTNVDSKTPTSIRYEVSDKEDREFFLDLFLCIKPSLLSIYSEECGEAHLRKIRVNASSL